MLQMVCDNLRDLRDMRDRDLTRQAGALFPEVTVEDSSEADGRSRPPIIPIQAHGRAVQLQKFGENVRACACAQPATTGKSVLALAWSNGPSQPCSDSYADFDRP